MQYSLESQDDCSLEKLKRLKEASSTNLGLLESHAEKLLDRLPCLEPSPPLPEMKSMEIEGTLLEGEPVVYS